jgi:Calx-beta domain
MNYFKFLNFRNGVPALAFVSLLGVAALLGCEEQKIIFDQTPFVRFSDTTLSFKESYTKVIKVRIHNAGPQLSESIIVNYTVGGTAREGRDYRILGTKGAVSIPANQSFGEIQVQLINNANNILGSSSIDFSLTSANPSDKVQVGLGKLGKTMSLTIRDACLLDGIYSGNRQVAANRISTVSDIEISSNDCRTYTLANWNIDLFSFTAIKPTLQFVDNGNNTLTIPPQINSELSPPRDTISGTGLWNPQNRRITLNLRLRTVSNTTRRDTTVTIPITYTPQ